MKLAILQRTILFFLFALCWSSCRSSPLNSPKLRVMSINTWQSGTNVDDSLRKFAHFINQYDPDIISFQETFTKPMFAIEIGEFLNRRYQYVFNNKFWNPLIFSRYKIQRNSAISLSGAVGVNITIPGWNTLQFWAVHLTYRNYGPDAAKLGIATDEEIMAAEYTGESTSRYKQAQDIIYNVKEQRYSGPLMIVGDFNTASHLDWTESTRHMHYDRVIEWPVSKVLTKHLELSDAYRTIYPDPLSNPGFTWTPINPLDTQDRIDWMLYRQLRPLHADVVPNFEELEIHRVRHHHHNNSWPSDHAALLFEFELR